MCLEPLCLRAKPFLENQTLGRTYCGEWSVKPRRWTLASNSLELNFACRQQSRETARRQESRSAALPDWSLRHSCDMVPQADFKEGRDWGEK